MPPFIPGMPPPGGMPMPGMMPGMPGMPPPGVGMPPGGMPPGIGGMPGLPLPGGMPPGMGAGAPTGGAITDGSNSEPSSALNGGEMPSNRIFFFLSFFQKQK